MKMLTIHPLDRQHEIQPSRLTSLRRVPTAALGLVLSVVAASAAVIVSTTTSVSDLAIVGATLAVGFMTSWFNGNLPARR